MQIASRSCQGRAAGYCPIRKQAINKPRNWALSHFQVAVNTFKFKAKFAASSGDYRHVLHFNPAARAGPRSHDTRGLGLSAAGGIRTCGVTAARPGGASHGRGGRGGHAGSARELPSARFPLKKGFRGLFTVTPGIEGGSSLSVCSQIPWYNDKADKLRRLARAASFLFAF